MWNVHSVSEASNNFGNWNHLQIVPKITDQQIGKARKQGTTENNHLVHFKRCGKC